MAEIIEGAPAHIGFICDGNRRWAKARGLPVIEGHRQGVNTVKEVLKGVLHAGVKFVTFYIFSTENWGRAQEEVSGLMGLVRAQIKKLAQELKENNVKLLILGGRERVDEDILRMLSEAEEMTADCDGGTACVCFNYGGKQEIVDAARAIVSEGGEVSEEALAAHMYHPEVPDVDMVVRTSGEERISGFMLWRAAYAEMLFLEKYWPEMSQDDARAVVEEFVSRNRRFGK